MPLVRQSVLPETSRAQVVRWIRDMDKPGAGFDHDRYRKMLAEATDERKRLALIHLLIVEKAKDRLAQEALHARLARLGLSTKPKAD